MSHSRQGVRISSRPATSSFAHSRAHSRDLETAGPSSRPRPVDAPPNALGNGNGRGREVRPRASGLHRVASESTIQSSSARSFDRQGSSRSIVLVRSTQTPARPCPPMINGDAANGTIGSQGLPLSASGVGPPAMNEWKQSHPVPKSTVCADEITQKMSNMLAFQQTLKPTPAPQKPNAASTISRFVPHRVVNKVSSIWGKLHAKTSDVGGSAQSKPSNQCAQRQADGQGLPISLSHIPASHSISSILTLEIRLNEGHNLNRKKVQQIVGGGVHRKPVADDGKSIRCGRYLEDPFSDPVRGPSHASAGYQYQSQTQDLTDHEPLLMRSDDVPLSELLQSPHHDPSWGEPSEAGPLVLHEYRPARQGHVNGQQMLPTQNDHVRGEHTIAQQNNTLHERAQGQDEHVAPQHMPAHHERAAHERALAHHERVQHEQMPAQGIRATQEQMSAPDDHAIREQVRAHHDRISREGTPARRGHISHRRMPAYDDRIDQEHMPADYDRIARGNRLAHDDDAGDDHDAHRRPKRETRVRFQLSENAEIRSQPTRASSHCAFESEAGFEENLDDRILSTLPVGSSTPRYAAQAVEMPSSRDQRRSRQGPSSPPDHFTARPGDATDSSENGSIESQSLISLDSRDEAFEADQESGETRAIEAQEVEEAGGADDAQRAPEVASARPRTERSRAQQEGEMRRVVGMKKHPSPSKDALEDLSEAFEHYYYLKSRGAGEEVDELARRWTSASALPPYMRNGQPSGSRLQTWESASSSESRSTPRVPLPVDGEEEPNPPGRIPPASRFDQIPRLPHAHPPLGSQRHESSEWQ